MSEKYRVFTSNHKKALKLYKKIVFTTNRLAVIMKVQ